MIPREPEEKDHPGQELDTTETEDLEGLKKLLAEEKTKAGNYLANWQRAQADFVNYKRRVEQDRQEFSKFAGAALIQALLPVLDDLDLALNSVSGELAEDSWVDGIKLIDRKLRTSLEAQGVSPIEALGAAFDPNLHEAVRQDKGEEGIVINEVKKGYKFHDRVLRPSQVVVGNGETGE